MAHNIARSRLASTASPVPEFLAPCLLYNRPQPIQISSFSTTPAKHKITRDRNRQRGVSALRRTGTKYVLPISKEPLPEPVLDPAKRSKLVGNKEHGLWEFFDKDRKPFVEPEKEGAHGRHWSVEELRQKSFEDLHSLWWICVKERNRLATQETERQRVKAGYGEAEFEERDKTVRLTMRGIKHTLTERWYAYEDARKLAAKSPELSSLLEDPAQTSVDESTAQAEDNKSTQLDT